LRLAAWQESIPARVFEALFDANTHVAAVQGDLPFVL
jgi:hypothetical protein